jgi:neutral ceramidase
MLMRVRTGLRWAGLLSGVLVLLLLTVPFGRMGGAGVVRVLSTGSASQPLEAGAGKAAVVVPFPVVVAGYGTVRPEVDRAAVPIMARALVLASGAERVGLVTQDVLLADNALVHAIRAGAGGLHLSALWVLATHSHSSLGAYAANPVAQVAGTGRFRAEVRAALVTAALQALSQAAGTLQPVTLWSGESSVEARTASRDEFPEVDARLTRLVLRGAKGEVGQILVFACHPTLVARPPAALDPDWPGRLARREEGRNRGVTLVLQGSVGNVTAARLEGGGTARLDGLVDGLDVAVGGVPLRPMPAELAHSTVETTLPGPDASRLVPRLARTAAENVLLWPWAPRRAEVALLLIGDARLLGVPVETTAASGLVLEGAAGGARAVSLANGYLGYVEPAERVGRAAGESRRQLFGPSLLDALRNGVAAGASALRF